MHQRRAGAVWPFHHASPHRPTQVLPVVRLRRKAVDPVEDVQRAVRPAGAARSRHKLTRATRAQATGTSSRHKQTGTSRGQEGGSSTPLGACGTIPAASRTRPVHQGSAGSAERRKERPLGSGGHRLLSPPPPPRPRQGHRVPFGPELMHMAHAHRHVEAVLLLPRQSRTPLPPRAPTQLPAHQWPAVPATSPPPNPPTRTHAHRGTQVRTRPRPTRPYRGAPGRTLPCPTLAGTRSSPSGCLCFACAAAAPAAAGWPPPRGRSRTSKAPGKLPGQARPTGRIRTGGGGERSREGEGGNGGGQAETV